MGYHEYKNVWTPVIREVLACAMEPGNVKDKYAVAVKKSNDIIGHLPLGKNGRFAKTIFYFLKSRETNTCKAVVTGNSVNLGKGKGMEVPCQLVFNGDEQYINLLKSQFVGL